MPHLPTPMDPTSNILLLLIFLGAAQGIFLGLILWWHNRGKRTTNRLLAALLIVCSVVISNFVYCQTTFLEAFPHLAETYIPLAFLGGPLFLFYVRALTIPGFRLKRRDLLHTVPAVTAGVYMLPFYLQSGPAKLQSLLEDSSYVNWWIVLGLLCLHLLAYLIWVIRLITRHAEGIKNIFSSTKNVNLAWLRNLIIAFLAICALSLVLFVGREAAEPLAFTVPLVLSLIIYAVGYLGFRQPEIFSGPGSESAPSNGSTEKYAKSTLSQEQAGKYLARLQRFMEEEKPHLNPTLTLPELAEALSVSVHHLSQVINEQLGQNFFDFINSQRVEEAKRRLTDPRSAYLTISAIGDEAGFNSKSAFYAAFRKHTGMTPSQFKSGAQGTAMAA